MRRPPSRIARLLLRWRLLVLPAAWLGCDSPVDPASVSLAGMWWAPNAYSGCSVTLDLAENTSGAITGLATSVCPSPGPVSSEITGTRSGAVLHLSFAAGPGAPEHEGCILDDASLRLDFSFPEGVQRVGFTRGIPED
jgi:hypothetical protein